MFMNKQTKPASVVIIEGILFYLLGLFSLIYELKILYIFKAFILILFIILAVITSKELIRDTLINLQTNEIPLSIIYGAMIGGALLDAVITVLVVLQVMGKLPKIDFPF